MGFKSAFKMKPIEGREPTPWYKPYKPKKRSPESRFERRHAKRKSRKEILAEIQRRQADCVHIFVRPLCSAALEKCPKCGKFKYFDENDGRKNQAATKAGRACPLVLGEAVRADA